MTRSIIPWKEKETRKCLYAATKAKSLQLSASIKAHGAGTVIAKPIYPSVLKSASKYK